MTAPHRVGLIVPSSNVTMETELPALLGRHPAAAGRGVTFHSSRAVLHRVDAESLRRMVAESERGDQSRGLDEPGGRRQR